MKKTGLILIMLTLCIGIACAAVSFPPETSLWELSQKTEIPVKKYILYLELSDNVDINASLETLKITDKDIEKAQTAYKENLIPFYSGVVMVGMAIVFASLIITGLVIAQLKRISNKPKKKVKTATVKTSAGKVTGPADHLSSNAVVAAITAIYLHELEVEEQNKMLLTWKRAPLSMWKASNIMPNNEYFQAKRNR